MTNWPKGGVHHGSNGKDQRPRKTGGANHHGKGGTNLEWVVLQEVFVPLGTEMNHMGVSWRNAKLYTQ